MGLGVKYTIGVDGQSGLSTLDLLNNKFNVLGSTAQTIGGKIQTAFTFAAIEESIRRTGEWAQNLEKSAIALGTTNEKLQAMNLLAQNANLDEGKVTGFFETLETKRAEAIKGNYDLIQSFQALGVTFKDLQHLNRGEIFGKMLGNSNVQNIVAGTPMGNAMENLVGQGNISSFQQLQRAGGGMTLDQFTNNAKSSGQIVGGEDVNGISNQWIQIKKDLQQALQNLAPIGKLLMSLATILSETVLGISNLFKNTISGNFKGIAALIMNGVFGFVKTFTGIIDGASNLIYKLTKHIPGLKAKPLNYTGYVQNAQDFYNNKLGASRNDIRGGEGIGNLAAIVGTGGLGGVAKMGSEGILDLAGVAEKAGAARLSSVMLNNAVRLDKASRFGLLAGGKGIMGTGATLASWMVGATGAMNQTPNNGTFTGGNSKDIPFNGITTFQNPTVFNGENHGQLKLGGVFGTGIQSRMIRLAQQQIDLLSQIVKNTSYLNQYRPVPTDNKPAGGA